jgi:hypothetical protein
MTSTHKANAGTYNVDSTSIFIFEHPKGDLKLTFDVGSHSVTYEVRDQYEALALGIAELTDKSEPMESEGDLKGESKLGYGNFQFYNENQLVSVIHSSESITIGDEVIAFDRPASQAKVLAKMPLLKQFIPEMQLRTMTGLIRSKEEGQYFKDVLVGVAEQVEGMPAVYQTEGESKAYLHYFGGDIDIYIIEKDSEAEQLQAYGYSDLGMGGPEFGYVDLTEVMKSNLELDLHFQPSLISELDQKQEKALNL